MENHYNLIYRADEREPIPAEAWNKSTEQFPETIMRDKPGV